MRQAEEGLRELKANVDTLISIPNQRLLAVASRSQPLVEAFRKADEVLLHAVRGISELITVHGLINLDFADVRTIMSEMGMAIMGAAVATGENRAEEAARRAIASPLLEDISIRGAKGVLINVTGGADLTLHEVTEAATLIQEEADEEANIIFGAVIDETLGDELRITVIATGFGEEEVLQPPTAGKPSLSALRGGVGVRGQQTIVSGTRKVVHMGTIDDLDVPTWQRKRQAENAPVPGALPPTTEGEDKYDIPAFLRKHAN